MGTRRILVACDAGAAGRELLARNDVQLAWALTPAEIEAWLSSHKPHVVLTREEIAPEVLERVCAAKRPPPVVVLLDPDGWDRRQAYFDQGATGLVQASNKQRILEAVSNLTGLTFASSTRVPFRDVVELTRDGETHLLQTEDLSRSGVAIMSERRMQIGERVDVDFVMSDPSPSAKAVVVRVEKREPGYLIGLCFDEPPERTISELDALVDGYIRSLPQMPEPVDMTGDLAGTFTMDLHTTLSSVKKPENAFREMLQQQIEPEDGLETPRLPSWLHRVADALTPLERRAIRSGAPPFASSSIDARIRIERSRANIDAEPMSQSDCRAILELCRALASEAESCADEDRGDVPVLRAALLSGVYGASQSAAPQTPARRVA